MTRQHFPADGEDVREEAVEVKVATMAVLGSTTAQIGKELGMHSSKVKRLMQTDKCVSTMRKLRDESIERAKAELCTGTAKLAKKILKVIEEALDDGNLKAVAPALKILGFGEEEQAQNASQYTIIMPGAANPDQPVDVTPKKGRANEI